MMKWPATSTLKEAGDFLGLHFSTISIIAKHVDAEKKFKT